jgi:hypothetical protein
MTDIVHSTVPSVFETIGRPSQSMGEVEGLRKYMDSQCPYWTSWMVEAST